MKRVMIVSQKSDINALRQVGETAARYLDSLLESGDTIGYSWGRTVYEVARALKPRDDLEDITTLQFCGGISKAERNVYVSEVTHALSKVYNGINYSLPFPAVVQNSKLIEILHEEKTMQDVLKRANQCNYLIMTVGSLGKQNTLVRAGYLKEEDIDAVVKKGAVAEVFLHYIDKDGKLCSPELDARTVAVPFQSIFKAKTRIGVAIGEEKVDGLLAALRGGIINVLVTNEETASMMAQYL